jgi:hypothetical chaperone protein
MPAMDARASVYAIDFGTTNSLIAAANADQTWKPLAIDPEASDPTVLRSVLFFSDDVAPVSIGQRALRTAAEGARGRLIRSVKRFLPVAAFNETRIGRRKYQLEELVAIILRNLRERANRELDADVRAAVLGFPARFSDDADEHELARARLLRAAALAGFERVELCEEPVAAALDSNSPRDQNELFAVADLGGGTSDFTVARLEGERTQTLAVGGVAVAGDALDGGLMRDSIAPHFGSQVAYRLPFGGNVLTFPKPLLERLCAPAELCLLDRPETLEMLRTIRSFSLLAPDRERIDRLLCLVEDRLGFQIFEAIDRVKRELSLADSAEFSFPYPSIEITETVERAAFDRSSAGAVERISQRFEQTLANAGVRPTELDRLYLTGGTAMVPAVVEALSRVVGADKLRRMSTFHSVINGLSERARALAKAGWA